MNLLKLKSWLLFILLTGLTNNSNAINAFILSDTITNTSFFESVIQKDAEDSIKIDVINRKAYLYGNAEIIYQQIKISAAYIEIDWNNNTIIASYTRDSLGAKIGYPIFKEKNETFKAEEIIYNYKSKKCRVKKINTKEGDGYILGKLVKKTEEDILYLHKGDYTTCDHDKPHYSIRANRIKIIPGKKIITGPAYLRFFNIPTPLFFPFGYFPNNDKKSSGIIIPSYGESTELGFFLKNGGYYFTINKKTDLSLKSDIYSKGSWALSSLMRYKKRYKYNGNLSLNYGNMINSEKGFPNYSIKKDFFLRWKHQQDPKSNPSLQFSSNVNAGSSTFHKNNSYNANEYLSNTFTSSISLNKRWIGTPLNLTSNLNHSQNTRTKKISLTLPNINFNMSRIFPLKKILKNGKSEWYKNIGVSYSMNTKNNITIADSLLFTKQSLLKMKNGIKHSIPISTSIKLLRHFTITQSINLTERWYITQIKKRWNPISNSIITDTLNKFTRGHNYYLSTGINTKIYGMLQFKKSKISALRHVITPNISFRFNPSFSKEKFGYYKNVQSDSLGNTTQYSIMQNGIFSSPPSARSGNITFGLSNILEIKTRNTKDTTIEFKKIKILENLNISSSYNIFSDSLNVSDISINARTRLLKIFDINFSSRYDPYIVNKNQTNNINEFEINTNNRIARLTSINTSIGISLSDKSFSTNTEEEEEEEDSLDKNFYAIPWAILANYSLTYNKGYKSSSYSDTIQSLNFSGNLKITDKWKIGFRSGYDFDENKLTYSSIDIYRDLHCWEMLFNWIPIGFHQSYTLTIRVKAASLRDLKFERKKDWFTPEYN